MTAPACPGTGPHPAGSPLAAATERLRSRVRWAALVELEALPADLDPYLSPRELRRAAAFGPRRRRAFAAGRIALKAAVTDGSPRPGAGLDFAQLDTLAEDELLARSPRSGALGVSISHDSRLAVAVASDRGVPGIDVEPLQERLGATSELFASPSERERAAASDLGELPSLLRIWTAKEACAKAWGVNLPTLWNDCELVELGEVESLARIGDAEIRIFHVDVAEHLLSLVERAP